MPAAWDVADEQLGLILSAYRGSVLNGIEFEFELYQNDYTPAPGSAEGDYVPCDFAGYSPQFTASGEWGAVGIVDHVAITTATVELSYSYTAGAGASQIVYGYFVRQDGDAYAWGERFSSPREVNPGDVILVTPRFRIRTYPY